MNTMRRWEMSGFGRQALALQTAALPRPAEDEVLVQVMSVALNHRDNWVIDSGRGLPLRFPFTPVPISRAAWWRPAAGSAALRRGMR